MKKLVLLAVSLLPLSGCVKHPAPESDDTTIIANELARHNHLPNKTPDVIPGKKYKRSECPYCMGTGKVGDGKIFVDCQACEPDTTAPPVKAEPPVVEQIDIKENVESVEGEKIDLLPPDEEEAPSTTQEVTHEATREPCCCDCFCGENCTCSYPGECLINAVKDKGSLGWHDVVCIDDQGGSRVYLSPEKSTGTWTFHRTFGGNPAKWLSRSFEAKPLPRVGQKEKCSKDCGCGDNCQCSFPGECLVNWAKKTYGGNPAVKVSECHDTWCEPVRVYKPQVGEITGTVELVRKGNTWDSTVYKPLYAAAPMQYYMPSYMPSRGGCPTCH